MYNDIFTKLYLNMLTQSKHYSYRVVNLTTNQQVKEDKNGNPFITHRDAYYFIQRDYAPDHVGEKIQIITTLPDGKDFIYPKDTFIPAFNRKGRLQLNLASTTERWNTNAKKYEDINLARSARRQERSNKRSQIDQIRADASAKIEELKKQIRQIMADRDAQIAKLLGHTTETNLDDTAETDINTLPPEDETIAAQTDIAEDMPQEIPEVSQENPEDMTTDMPQENPEDTTADMPQENPEDTTADMPQENPEDIPAKKAKTSRRKRK